MKNAPPSRNYADNDSLTGTLRLVLTKFLQGVDDMLPAKVLAYDRATNRARVQPLIYMVNTNNEIVNRGQVASVPVLQLGGGGFVISFPIRTGDLGWIKANDRDISLFKTGYEAAAPNTQRKHSFDDAVFIPDTMLKGFSINEDDAESVVLQNTTGTVKIAISDDGIKITSPDILMTTPLVTITGELIVSEIPFTTHKHTGVEPGGGNSGGPIA